MAEPGRRSKHTMVFMVPTDEHDFGTRLVEDLGQQATWTAVLHQSGGEQYRFPLLLAALDVAAGRRQAHLRLTDSDGSPVGPILQYTSSAFRWQDGRELLIAGELAYKWFPGEESPPVAQRFEALVRTAWRQLNACSLPLRGPSGWDTDPECPDRPPRQAVAVADQARLLGDSGARWFVFGLRPGR